MNCSWGKLNKNQRYITEYTLCFSVILLNPKNFNANRTKRNKGNTPPF